MGAERGQQKVMGEVGRRQWEGVGSRLWGGMNQEVQENTKKVCDLCKFRFSSLDEHKPSKRAIFPEWYDHPQPESKKVIS